MQIGRFAIVSVAGFAIISAAAHAIALVGITVMAPKWAPKPAPLLVEIRPLETPRQPPKDKIHTEAPPGAGRGPDNWKFGRMDDAKSAPSPSNGDKHSDDTRPAKSDTEAEEITKSPKNAKYAIDTPGTGGSTATDRGAGGLAGGSNGSGHGAASANGSPGGDEDGEGGAAGELGSARGGSPSLSGAAGGGLLPPVMLMPAPVDPAPAPPPPGGGGGVPIGPRMTDLLGLGLPGPGPQRPAPPDNCMPCPSNPCTNILTDPLNCGGCAVACKQGQTCLGAYCCGGEGEQFRVNTITLPSSDGQFAIDLDGDGVAENQFFHFLQAIHGFYPYQQNDLNYILYSRQENILWDVPPKTDLTKPFTLLQGIADPNPNYSGVGTYVADADLKSSQFPGTRTGDVFEFLAKRDQAPPILNLLIRSPNISLSFVIPFQCHHLTLSFGLDGNIEGALHGSLKRSDLLSDKGFLGQTTTFLNNQIDPNNKLAVPSIRDFAIKFVDAYNTDYCVNPDSTRGHPYDKHIDPCEILQSQVFTYDAGGGVRKSVFDPDLLVWSKTGQFEPRRNPTPKDPTTPNDSFSFGLTFTGEPAKIKNCGVSTPVDGGTHD